MTNVVVVSLVLNSFLRWQWWPSIGGCQGGIGRWGWRPPEAPPSSTVPPSTSPSTECHLNDQVPRYCCWSFAIHFCCCHCCCWWITGPRTLWAPVAKQASRWERLWRERRLWSHHTWATLAIVYDLTFWQRSVGCFVNDLHEIERKVGAKFLWIDPTITFPFFVNVMAVWLK